MGGPKYSRDHPHGVAVLGVGGSDPHRAIDQLREDLRLSDAEQSFAWDFSSNPTVHFELHGRSGELDPKTGWPPENERPTSWLALPRLLLAHCADGWPRENRRQWLVWTGFDFDGEKHVIYHKITLPDGRGLPERPTLADTGWE